MRRFVYFSFILAAGMAFAPVRNANFAQTAPTTKPAPEPSTAPKSACQKAIDLLYRLGKVSHYGGPDDAKLSLNVWWPEGDPEARPLPRAALKGPDACKRLRSLNIDMRRGDLRKPIPPRGANLTPLIEFSSMIYLSVSGRGFGNAELAPIARLAGLRDLSLMKTNLDDGGLRLVRGLTELRGLSLGSTRVRGAGLVHLTRLSRLTSLSISRNRIGDSAMVHVGKLRKLRGLSIAHTWISSRSARYFAGLKDLRRLDMRHTYLKGKGLRYFPRMGKLKMILIFGTPIGPTGFAYLARLPALTEIQLNGDQITDRSLLALTRARNWKRLNMWHTSWYEYGREAGTLSYSLKHYTKKEGTNHLNLRPTRTTGKILRRLRGINLTSLELSQFMKIHDVRLAARHLKKLERFNPGKKAERNALWHVIHMPRLKLLDISCTKLVRNDLMIVYRKRKDVKYFSGLCLGERFGWQPVKKLPKR